MAKNKQQEKPAVSFDEIIKADRSKRKAEALAQEIFGKNRRQSAPSANNSNNNNSRKPQTPLGGSLASRVGVQKRSASTASLPTLGKQQQQNRGAQRNRNGRQTQPSAHAAAVQAAVQQNQQSFTLNKRPHVPAPNSNGNDSEITIRGAAGPYCVVASNFAPGTTAADIESVMAPVGGEMAACKLLAAQPTVIAEMVFVDRAGAENVINMFNGKKADGRVLYVYLKEGGPSQPLTTAAPPRNPTPSIVEPVQEQGPEDSMEVEPQYPTEPSPIPPQEPSPRPSYSRPPRDGRASYREDYPQGPPRHAHPEYQDGRYGFSEQQRYDYDRRPRYRDEGRMYSDDMMRGGGRRGGRGQRYR